MVDSSPDNLAFPANFVYQNGLPATALALKLNYFIEATPTTN